MSSSTGVYSIQYDSSNHLAVIFKWHGSVWKRALPYCVINFLLAQFLRYMKLVRHVDLGFSDKGHSMMTMFVSFLIVSRVGMSLSRYNESRNYLGQMYRAARELVVSMVIFTQADQSDKAKQWRHDMAYDVCILLRLAMAVVDYPSQKIPCWQVPELRGRTKEYVMKNIALSRSIAAEGDAEMNMRVPIQVVHFIKEGLFKVNESVDPATRKLDAWQYTKLFSSVDNFMGGYYGMRKFLTTPFPFPLVQMARTFMFIYLYTLPFALLSLADNAWVHSTIVFLVTYGFVGLESVSIELDDPFGDDDNDFDNMGMMYTVWEDIYVTMCNADGEEWMRKLIAKLSINGEGDVASEKSPLLRTNNNLV